MKRSFKGGILLATLLVPYSVGVHASDNVKMHHVGKARIFMGNDMWASGNPDMVAAFSKDMEEIRVKIKMSPMDLSNVGFVSMLVMIIGLSGICFLAQDILSIATAVSIFGARVCEICCSEEEEKNREKQCQEAIIQRSKDLGLKVSLVK
jgi:hypothetical protein